MRGIRILAAVFVIIISGRLYGQMQREYHIKRFEHAPQIDGYEDSVWLKMPAVDNFFQYIPNNGSKASYKTVVRLGYTSKALYVFAQMFDNEKVRHYVFTERDHTGSADWFGIYLDSYGSGQVAYAFIVTVAGVQVDEKIIGTSENKQWDAVWKSAVRRYKDHWVVEMRIPFNQIRFVSKANVAWGLNFMRSIPKIREIDTWSYMDIKQQDKLTQYGKLIGLQGLRNSLHVWLYPYGSFYYEKNSAAVSPNKYFNGGMDLKLGLSRSFTLDMMLIPDFGEVMSDEPVLNLSPFETYYTEKRQFFTEGTEIFDICHVFYSRRIGGRPSKYYSVSNQLKPHEIVIYNPLESQILNATKLSGKTKNKIGIGMLEAFTANTYAEVMDTLTDSVRKILTEPRENFNVLAVTKDLPHGSLIGFINTNKFVPGRNYYVANVTGGQVSLKTKAQRYQFFVNLTGSYIKRYDTRAITGFSYVAKFAKIRGNFKYGFERHLYSANYNPNDLGYLAKNNIISNIVYLGYYIYKPFWVIRRWTTRLIFDYQTRYTGLKYIGTNINFQFYGTLKNLTSVGLRLNLTPDKVYNYYEPRVENFVYIQPPQQNYMFWVSTDYSKRLALDFQYGFYFPIQYKNPQAGYWYLVSPRFRLSDRLLLVYSFRKQRDVNNYGYVGTSAQKDSVFFGKRNVSTWENVLSLEYAFSIHSYLTLRVRHYWSLVRYSNYYALMSNGRLVYLPFSYRFVKDNNTNFNSFNIDLIYKWQFLPGSELSVAYKLQMLSQNNNIITKYVRNFEHFYNTTPKDSSISIKLIIYI